MRIVIDLQGAQTESRFRGIGRYSLSIAQAIARNRGDHEVIIALNGLFEHTIEPIRAAFEGILPQENIRVWIAPGPVFDKDEKNACRREAAEYIREAFLASLQPDIIFITSLFEGFDENAVISVGLFDKKTISIVTLHDLIPFRNPDQYLRSNPNFEAFYLRKIEHLKRAYAWLAVSKFSAIEGCGLLEFDKDRTSVVYEASDSRFQRIGISSFFKKKLITQYTIFRPFVLYAGGGDARKNLSRLIRAYSLLPSDMRKSHQLVMAGKLWDNELHDLIGTAKSAGLDKDELVFTGYVSDDELVQFYNLCELFIFPSWEEGFGLPALEAMSCGAPVIAANSSSLPEVLGREDALFDPFSEDSIASKIADVLLDESFREDLARHGIEQAKKFSWNNCAMKAISAFEQFGRQREQNNESLNTQSIRPKLAFISPLPPERSGIADYSAELLRALSQIYDIDVIVNQPEISDTWIKACLPVRQVNWFIKHFNRYDRLLYHIGNSLFHLHMFDLLDRFPGVVVLHDFFLSSAKAHLDLKGQLPSTWVPELYLSHGYLAVWERFHIPDSMDVVYKYPCNFSTIKKAVGIITHSAHSAQLAQDWYDLELDDFWKIVPLLRAPIGETDKMMARVKLGLSKDDFIVCCFGMIAPTKLNHDLIRAWLSSKLAKDIHCQLIFVGEKHDGDYGKKLEDVIHKNSLKSSILLTGWVDAETFRHYLASADMAVQLRTNSRGETSAAILDCMNFGLPTIVNANGSIAELPRDSVWMLPDGFNDSELIEALETLWQDSNKRQALGDRARMVVMEKHAPRICAEKYTQAIESFYAGIHTGTKALINKLTELDKVPVDEASIKALAASISQNMPSKHPAHQLLVDISGLVQTDLKTGIERVTRSILEDLLLDPPPGYRVEPVYAASDHLGYRYARNFTMRLLECPVSGLVDDLIETYPGDIFLGLELQSQIVPIQISYLKSLHDFGVKIIFIVYDLLPVLLPQHFPEGVKEIHSKWLSAIAQFDGAICISMTVADDIMEWLKINSPNRLRPFKIGHFKLGADVENSVPTLGLPDDAPHVLAALAGRPCFLMVGTIEPRKGYLQVIAAFDELIRQGIDINLAIVGNEGWKGVPEGMRRTIPEIVNILRSHPERDKRLFWLEGISDEYLEKVYAASTCLIAASEGEGFGLPLIEAAKHNLPIIARDISVFHEVAGDHAFYFKGKEPSDLAKAVQEWLELFKNDRHPKPDGISCLTWKQSTRQMLDVILKENWYEEWIPQKAGK